MSESTCVPVSIAEEVVTKCRFSMCFNDINDALDKKYGVGEINWHWFYKSPFTLSKLADEIWSVKMSTEGSPSQKVRSLGTMSTNFLDAFNCVINYIIDNKRVEDGKVEKYDNSFRMSTYGNLDCEYRDALSTLKKVCGWLKSKGATLSTSGKTIEETVEAAKVHKKNFYDFLKDVASTDSDAKEGKR